MAERTGMSSFLPKVFSCSIITHTSYLFSESNMVRNSVINFDVRLTDGMNLIINNFDIL